LKENIKSSSSNNKILIALRRNRYRH